MLIGILQPQVRNGVIAAVSRDARAEAMIKLCLIPFIYLLNRRGIVMSQHSLE
jgi:hypothetical protein